MFSDVAEIGDCYNGVCTSYRKFIHGVGNKLLLHRATAACMNNQIKFIINHITAQPEFLEGNGLFKAFQENQAKFAEVEAGICAEYIRGEGTLLPKTLALKWRTEQNQDNNFYQEPSPPGTPSNLKQPPELLQQIQTYVTPMRQTVNLSQDYNTPPLNGTIDHAIPTSTQNSTAPVLTQSQTLQASYAENFYPLELALAEETNQNSKREPEVAVCNYCLKHGFYTNDFTHCQECYSNVHNGCTREYNQRTICLSCKCTLIIQAQDGKQDSTSDSHTKQSNKTTTDDYSTSNDKDGDNNDVDNEDLERIIKSKIKTKESPTTISARGNKGHPL
jgi:hypothetical protein